MADTYLEQRRKKLQQQPANVPSNAPVQAQKSTDPYLAQRRAKLSTPSVIPEQPKGIIRTTSDTVSKVYDAYSNIAHKTYIPQAVGAVVGAVGGAIGGATAAVGKPISDTVINGIRAYQGKPIIPTTLKDYGSSITKNAKDTASFGYSIGDQGATAAPLGGLGRIPAALAVLPLAVTTYDKTKQAIKTGNKSDITDAALDGVLTALSIYGVKKAPGTLIAGDSAITSKVVAPARARAISSLEQTYEELLTGNKTAKKKFNQSQIVTERKNLAGTDGRPPQTTLAEAGIIPKQRGARLDTVGQANEFRQSTRPLQSANRKALQEVEQSTPPIDFSQAENKAIEKVVNSRNTSGDKESMIAKIHESFDAARREYGPSGKITLFDDQKSAHWDKTKFDTAVPQLDRDVHYAIAKGYQQVIEETANQAGYKEVAQLNREVGDRLEAAKFLESLDSKVVRRGQLGKYVFGVVGSTLGHTIPAKIIGYLGGEAVANMLISNAVAGPVKRLLLKNLQTENPQAYNEAIKWLNEQSSNREGRLLLPAPAEKGSYTNPHIVPPNTNPEPGPVRNYRSTPNGRVISDIPRGTVDDSRVAAGLLRTPEPLGLPAPRQSVIELPQKFPRNQSEVDAAYGRSYSNKIRASTQPTTQATIVDNTKPISTNIPQKTKSVQSVNKFRFHETSLKNLESIKKNGLKPTTGQYGKGVYFAPKLGKNEVSGNGVILRVDKKYLDDFGYQEWPGEQGWTDSKGVPPKFLQYSNDGGKNWFDLSGKSVSIPKKK